MDDKPKLATPKRYRIGVAHRRSPKQEKEAAKRLGGKVVIGSGSGKWEKGDVRIKDVLRLEAKTTTKKSFTITREMVRKIMDAALSSAKGEVPCMEIEFLSSSGKPEISVALVPVYVLRQLAAEGNAHEG